MKLFLGRFRAPYPSSDEFSGGDWAKVTCCCCHVRMRPPLSLTFAVLTVAALLMTGESACPTSCVCRWKGGKETVECVGLGLTSLPTGIDGGTRVLDLSGNSLHALPKDMFVASGLPNLQRIYMANCKIGRIDDNTFSGLSNLVEIDLSNNLITAVPSEIFKDFKGLRRIVLSENPITRLENDAFLKLPTLTHLEMSRCRVEVIMPRAFDGPKSLISLKIDNNRLGNIPGRALAQLTELHGIELHANPWRCDCHFRELRHWLLTSGKSYGSPPVCTSPEALAGYNALEVNEEQFACAPSGVYFNPRNRILEIFSGKTMILLCRVAGEPEPITRWIWQGKTIANMSSFAHGSQLYIIREKGTTTKETILEVTSVTEDDSGDYWCAAENRAGRFVTNFTVVVETREPELASLTSTQIAGIGVGLLVLGLVVLVLIWVFVMRWRQSYRDDSKNTIVHKIPSKQTNSLSHPPFEISKEQFELKGPNPVKKPPRASTNPSYSGNQDLSPYERQFLENSIGGPGPPPVRVIDNNKPDVVNVTKNVIVEPACMDRTSDLRNVNTNHYREEGVNRREDKMPDLQESLNYSPESPVKERWDPEYDKNCPFAFENMEPKVQFDIVEAENEWKAQNHDLPVEWGVENGGDIWEPPCMSNSLSEYDVGKNEGPYRGNWQDRYPGYTSGDRLPQSRSHYLMSSAPFGQTKNPNVRFRNLVPVLPPFPPPQPLRVNHSPDEGYEDEGEEGTEV